MLASIYRDDVLSPEELGAEARHPPTLGYGKRTDLLPTVHPATMQADQVPYSVYDA